MGVAADLAGPPLAGELGLRVAQPEIVQQPSNTSCVEGGTVVIAVQANPLSPASVQWQRNGADLPGATSTTLEYGPVRLTDHQARFRAVLSNQLGSVMSNEGMLTVMADVTKPTVVEVLNLSVTSVRVRFNEPLEHASATAPG